MLKNKKRLDLAIVEKGLAQSRERARSLIMAGKVLVDNYPVSKPGAMISHHQEIIVKEQAIPYVSRGGLKLESALRALDIRVEGYICLDVGASTGGFTDCLLQHGASQVFAVDVGYGQLAWQLRQDPRVKVIERTNIRYMPAETLPCPVDFITIDVSFISLKIVVPAVLKFMKKTASVLALIKPQFEVGKGLVGKGGVVRDPELHNRVIKDLSSFFVDIGFIEDTLVPSALPGPKGNTEFFILLRQSNQGVKNSIFKS
jgi:23S rRNA (cytidine1920-2'-O)/16S rRNA (cytidine1409-2'-O)-methyltransferase